MAVFDGGYTGEGMDVLCYGVDAFVNKTTMSELLHRRNLEI